MDDDDTRRIIAAIDMLPALTRTVYLLPSFDEMAWPDIARRSGLSIAEIELRLTAALSSLRHGLDDGPNPAMRARSASRLSPRPYGSEEGEGDSCLPRIAGAIRGLVQRWRRQPP